MYILSISTMIGGNPFHNEPELHDTEESAYKSMKRKIEYKVRNYLAIKEYDDWDKEEANKRGIDFEINSDNGKVVLSETPLENYSYYYIDEVDE